MSVLFTIFTRTPLGGFSEAEQSLQGSWGILSFVTYQREQTWTHLHSLLAELASVAEVLRIPRTGLS